MELGVETLGPVFSTEHVESCVGVRTFDGEFFHVVPDKDHANEVDHEKAPKRRGR